jgi:hypothetical protein
MDWINLAQDRAIAALMSFVGFGSELLRLIALLLPCTFVEASVAQWVHY